jgi:hypothetical protein
LARTFKSTTTSNSLGVSAPGDANPPLTSTIELKDDASLETFDVLGDPEILKKHLELL